MLPSTRTILCLGLISISIILVQPTPLTRSHQYSESKPLASAIPVPSQDIWDNKSFWNYDFDLQIYYIIDAYLLAFGDHCYIYFEDSVITALGEAESFDRAELYRDEFGFKMGWSEGSRYIIPSYLEIPDSLKINRGDKNLLAQTPCYDSYSWCEGGHTNYTAYCAVCSGATPAW